MSIQCGDYVRPNNPNAGLPQGSVWLVVFATGEGKLDLSPKNEIASHIRTAGRYFAAGHFDKVVMCRGQWVTAKNVKYTPFFNPDDLMRDVLEYPLRASMTTAVANGAGTVACTQAVDPVQAALSIADNAVVSAEQKLADAKEQARKQRVIAAEKARAKAKADKEAAQYEAEQVQKAAFRKRLDDDQALAQATYSLVAEVRRLFIGGMERLASSDITQYADKLDALAKSYGYKIIRTGSKSVVAKA